MDKQENNERFSTFNANPAAVQKLRKMTRQIQEVCIGHGIPFVVAFCVEADEGKYGITMSAYMDSDKTPAPINIQGAIEMLKSEDVPPEMVMALTVLNEQANEQAGALQGRAPGNVTH